MSKNRQPAGIPTGGEFAANAHDEAGVLSADTENVDDIVDRVREGKGDYLGDLDRLEEMAAANGNRQEASELADQVREQSGDYYAALDGLGELADPSSSYVDHDTTVAEMMSLVHENYPNARGIAFDPNSDEIDYDWEDDYEDAWIDAGAVERTPLAVFGEDPAEQTEFDDDTDADLVAKLRNLSKGLDRDRCGFTAIGEYQIEVHFD